MLEIRVDEREIFGRPPDMSHPYGLFVRKDGFQGWQGLPAGRREALARAVQHGEFDVPVFLPARVVTVDGWAIAPNEMKLESLSNSFTGIGATGRRSDMSVDHQGRLLTARGRRILAECEDKGISTGKFLRAEFQLQMVFPDPRKYSGETSTLPESGVATAIDVNTYGNFPAFPEIELVSPPSAYTIKSPGGTFTVSGATPGGVHVVNLRNGRVFRSGVEMPGVGGGDLWAVPAGQRWRHSLSTPGRIRITDTFV